MQITGGNYIPSWLKASQQTAKKTTQKKYTSKGSQNRANELAPTQNQGAYYDPARGFVTSNTRFKDAVNQASGATQFAQAIPAWASEARFAQAAGIPARRGSEGGTVMSGAAAQYRQPPTPVLPSYFAASRPTVDRQGARYSTQNVPGFGTDPRQSVPVVTQQPMQPSEYTPTSMPIVERTMDYLNQNAASPYLPSWMTGQAGSGGPDWWGNYRKRGGGGGYGGYDNNYMPNWYTGLYQLNANR